MDENTGRPRVRGRLEGGIRRGFELLLLGVALIFGVGIVGGCAAVVGGASEGGVAVAVGGLAAGVLLVAIVYLATSMSRDVRLLKRRLLDEEQRAPGGDPKDRA